MAISNRLLGWNNDNQLQNQNWLVKYILMQFQNKFNFFLSRLSEQIDSGSVKTPGLVKENQSVGVN